MHQYEKKMDNLFKSTNFSNILKRIMITPKKEHISGTKYVLQFDKSKVNILTLVKYVFQVKTL